MKDRSFFQNVPQETIEAGDLSGKLPCFYYDNTALSLIYTARLDRLRELLPDARYSPLRLTPRRGVVAITAFNYRETDIGPYNELSIAILLDPPGQSGSLPGLGLLRQNWAQTFHAFVVELPVTTEIARRGGVELYNYPKFLAEIDFTDRGERISCRLGENGKDILTITAPKLPTRRATPATYCTYPCLEGEILRAEVRLNPIAMGLAYWPSAAGIEIGRGHRICDRLSRLELGRRPLQYQYLADMQAILYGAKPLAGHAERAAADAAVA